MIPGGHYRCTRCGLARFHLDADGVCTSCRMAELADGCGLAHDGFACTPAYLCDRCEARLLELTRRD